MIVYEQGLTPCGGASKSFVKITLWGAGRAIAGRDVVNGTLVQGECTVIPDASGYWQVDLTPTSYIAPENTTYRIERTNGCEPIVSYITVPSEGGPYEAFTIEGDPMNTITPSALSAHAGDLTLHGGGIEVDYAEITSSVPVTGAATSLQMVTGLSVDIPDIPRPVDVTARAHITTSTTSPIDVGLSNQWDGITASQIFIFFLIDSTTYEPTTSSITATVNLYFRVPANSPQTIAVCARATNSPYIATVVASTLQKSSIRARTA